MVVVTIRAEGTSNYTGNPYDPGAAGTLSFWDQIIGLPGGKTVDQSLTRSLLPGTVVTLVFYLQDNVRRTDTFTVTDEAAKYRRLDFALTNSTSSVQVLGIERRSEPGIALHPTTVDGVGGASSIIKVGAEAAVTIYLAMSDMGEYRASFEDPEAERAAWGGVSQKLGYDRPDGARSIYFSGYAPLASPIGGWVPASSGAIVSSIPPESGEGTGGTAPTAPMDPTAKRVADGSANPATGKEVTDSANAVLEQAHSDAVAMQKSVDAVRGAIDAEAQAQAKVVAANPTADKMRTDGQAAGSEIAGKYGAAPAAVNYTSGVQASAVDFSVELPATFGGAVFDLDPFRADRLGPVCDWLRKAIEWAAWIALGALVWKEIGEFTRGLATIRQAQGNAAVGGTGAQATALVAAGIMTTAIVVATTGLMSWAFGDATFAKLASVQAANPLIGIPAKVLWFLDQVFPVATLLLCFVARISFRFYGTTLFATCSAVIRFVVP